MSGSFSARSRDVKPVLTMVVLFGSFFLFCVYLKKAIDSSEAHMQHFYSLFQNISVEIQNVKQSLKQLDNNNKRSHGRQVRKLNTILHLAGQTDYILNDRSSYLYLKNRHLHSLLNVYCLENNSLVRVGRGFDGGYMMVDHFSPDQIAYSFGINDDVSWDKSMAERGIHTYMYDHTIKSLPETDLHFHWTKRGIRGRKFVEGCDTLETFLSENGHMEHRNLILKLDVEGAEWDVLADTPTTVLEWFDQIVLEFHGLCNFDQYEKNIGALQNILQTHKPVWIHGNNYGEWFRVGDLITPNVLEVTFVRSSSYALRKCNQSFPLPDDIPNNRGFYEIYLGTWNVD